MKRVEFVSWENEAFGRTARRQEGGSEAFYSRSICSHWIDSQMNSWMRNSALRMALSPHRFGRLEYCRNTEIQCSFRSASVASSTATGSPSFPISMDVDPIEDRFLLSGASDGSVTLFDLSNQSRTLEGSLQDRPYDTIRPSQRSASPARKFVSSVQWYPIDTGAFMTASFDGIAAIWDATSFEPIGEFETHSIIYAAKMNHSGSLIAAALVDNSVRLIDPNTGGVTHSMGGHTMAATSVDWSSSSPFILASSSLGSNLNP